MTPTDDLDDLDLLVVGCGPVGVSLALLCARRGLHVAAVDRSREVYDLPRAIVMDAEIQRVLLDGGLDVAPFTTPLRGAEFVTADGERVTGIEIPDGFVGPDGLPPAVVYEQPELEAHLRAAAASAGVRFLLGCELTGVDPDPGGVTAHLVDLATGSTLTRRAAWLVGADGARSTVRKLCEVPFLDQGFDQEWLVVDTWLRREVELPELVQQICDPARPITVVPGHDQRRRFEFQLQPGETAAEMTEPDRVAELLAPWLAPDEARIDRAVVYRFHALVAATFAQDRVLLAGDAAHQMPPFNGQGLCTGMRDAANLAWKLDLVQRGVADPTLVDTYDRERRPLSEQMVVHSADAGKLIDAIAGRQDHGTVEELLDAGYGAGRPFPRMVEGLVRPDHPSVGSPVPMPTLHGRPFADLQAGRFALIAADSPWEHLDDATAATWRDLGAIGISVGDDWWFSSIVADGRVGIVRPDHYLAAVAADDELHEVTAQLTPWRR